MATETERTASTVLAPGITATPGVQGGEPCIAGTRIEPGVPHSWWYGGVGWPAILDRYPTLPSEMHWAAAVAFEAGRLYGQHQATRDKRQRWVGTINDGQAWRDRGVAEAVSYLRAAGQADLAAGLEAALAAKEGE